MHDAVEIVGRTEITEKFGVDFVEVVSSGGADVFPFNVDITVPVCM